MGFFLRSVWDTLCLRHLTSQTTVWVYAILRPSLAVSESEAMAEVLHAIQGSRIWHGEPYVLYRTEAETAIVFERLPEAFVIRTVREAGDLDRLAVRVLLSGAIPPMSPDVLAEVAQVLAETALDLKEDRWDTELVLALRIPKRKMAGQLKRCAEKAGGERVAASLQKDGLLMLRSSDPDAWEMTVVRCLDLVS